MIVVWQESDKDPEKFNPPIEIPKKIAPVQVKINCCRTIYNAKAIRFERTHLK